MLELIPGYVYTYGVTLLIATIAYPSQVFVFAPALKDVWSCFKVLGPLNLLVIAVYYNYYLCVTTDPGQVPANWQLPSSLLITGCDERRAQGITAPRFCKVCDIYKPPRTHHCRYCKRCVLKMDHHCPWINNCVGHGNYPHFLRFLFYVDIACAYVVTLLILRIQGILEDLRHFRFDSEPSVAETVCIVTDFVLAFVVLFSVGILSVVQFYGLARNQSTIEGWERKTVRKLIQRGKIKPVEYPFDIGVYANICDVLGDNPLLWLWPQTRVPGDGLSFPVKENIDPELPFYWPPRDPDDLRPSIFSSRYQRQRKLGQNSSQQQQDEATLPLNADITVDSDEYYDSGSGISDSEPEYTIADEEQGMGSRPKSNLIVPSNTVATSISDDTFLPHRRRRDSHPLLENGGREYAISNTEAFDEQLPLSIIAAPKSPDIVNKKEN